MNCRTVKQGSLSFVFLQICSEFPVLLWLSITPQSASNSFHLNSLLLTRFKPHVELQLLDRLPCIYISTTEHFSNMCSTSHLHLKVHICQTQYLTQGRSFIAQSKHTHCSSLKQTVQSCRLCVQARGDQTSAWLPLVTTTAAKNTDTTWSVYGPEKWALLRHVDRYSGKVWL